jgi:hypothetical protein
MGNDGWILRIFWFLVDGFSSSNTSEAKTSRDAVGLHEEHRDCTAEHRIEKPEKSPELT